MPLKILIADDEDSQRSLRKAHINADFPGVFEFVEVETGAQGVDACGKQDFFAIITDFNMPPDNGVEMISQLKAKGALPPILMVTSEVIDAKAALQQAGLESDVTVVEKSHRKDSVVDFLSEVITPSVKVQQPDATPPLDGRGHGDGGNLR